LEEITLICVLNGVRLLLAWSCEEGGKILEILHVFGPDRASDIARGVIGYNRGDQQQWMAQAKDAIMTIQGGVGQKDSAALIHHFGSLRKLLTATREELSAVPSIGVKKSNHLFNVFNATWSSTGVAVDEHSEI
jgi:ERCC4-type nuclease